MVTKADYILPLKFIRLRDAPRYLGMDKRLFNTLVRPYVSEIPIGRQGVAFDIQQLNAWADEYIKRQARPPRQLWEKEKVVVTSKTKASSKPRSKTASQSLDEEFNRLITLLYKPSSQ